MKRVRQSSPMISSDSDDDLGAHKILVSNNPKSKKPKKSLKSAAIEEKQESVEKVKTQLRGKHGTSYTPIQYTLWAEMIDVGTHNSIEEPPSVPMFQ